MAVQRIGGQQRQGAGQIAYDPGATQAPIFGQQAQQTPATSSQDLVKLLALLRAQQGMQGQTGGLGNILGGKGGGVPR